MSGQQGSNELAPPGTIVESDALRSAGRLRREPFVLLFPLGVLLSWLGVAHWLLYALGALDEFRPRFHALVQIQGFMTCLAVGFLMTMIPRRTGTRPPAGWQVMVVAAGPALMAAAAWQQRWVLAQLSWLAVALTTVGFIVRRFARASDRRPPNAFVWIPAALTMGIGGALMIAQSVGDRSRGLELLVGTRWVQQGMLTGLVLGVGSLALPLMTRGQGPPDGGAGPRDRRVRAAHLAGALVVASSFWVEVSYSVRLGLLMRATVVLLVYVFAMQLWRAPLRPGYNARLIQGAAWMLPLGMLVGAVWPLRLVAGLHVSFVGGFALLGLAVSVQVTLGHGGYREVLFSRSRMLVAMAGLGALATICRVLMEFDRPRYFLWMGAASACFLLATVAWARLVAPGILSPRPPAASP